MGPNQPSDHNTTRGSGEANLQTLIDQHCGLFGPEVCDAVLRESAQPGGIAHLLARLEAPVPDSLDRQMEELAKWLKLNGARAFHKMIARSQSRKDSPDPPKEVMNGRERDRRMMELLIQRQREKSRKVASPGTPPIVSSPAAPVQPTPRRAYQPPAQPIRRASPKRGDKEPSIPIFKPYAKAKSLRGRPENPISGSAPRDPTSTGVRSYTPAAGYPWPWPANLKPGPEPPPPHIPPHQLTWPYIDRRLGEDRRKNQDRRQAISVVSKNRRFGGDRRKGDRRKNPYPKK